MAMDVSYVGNHGYNRMGALQGGSTVNLNSIDIGAAYLPQNQDPTKAASTVPGANAYTTNLLRPYQGLGQHQPADHRVLGHLPLDPGVVEPPVPQRILVRCELHLRDLVQGQHRPGSSATCTALMASFRLRDDQDEYEKLNETLDALPHS